MQKNKVETKNGTIMLNNRFVGCAEIHPVDVMIIDVRISCMFFNALCTPAVVSLYFRPMNSLYSAETNHKTN